MNTFDVIIVGGGHAGTEAALAAARMGVNTLLLTHNIDTLGQMSCNPAIGGIGKGHLVKEIDALGGAMASAADKAGIQFRRLNARKGPAVRATRAQADRVLYKQAVRHRLETQENLHIFQQSVDDLIIENQRVAGVITHMGLRFFSRAVVLTVGTFLDGKIHVGQIQASGGRAGDPPAKNLALRLRDIAPRVQRLKTGTPPRIDGRSIDYQQLDIQPGDNPRPVFSFLGSADDHPQQLPCHISYTTEKTHDIIRAALSQSAMYSGAIEGVGPRYCPSIEDKIVRFADKTSHQIFVEPEGLTTYEVYPNGISTSLPYPVQLEFVRSMKGFANAHITRPGYAIEYDFFDPRDLSDALQTKHCPGLFFAGQINGTTGYEEAAAQGLIAGMNAARLVRDQAFWCPGREEAYIGVLIDDLITLGTQEPYRMFTSRAEYRLMLREDNADLRLTEKGRALGLVSDKRWEVFSSKRHAIEDHRQRLNNTWIQANSESARLIETITKKPLQRETNAIALLRRADFSFADLLSLPSIDLSDIPPDVAEQIEIATKYAGYIERQQADILRVQKQQQTPIPHDFNYQAISGLSNEVKQKLSDVRPTSIGQAGRISGVTPAALSLLLIYLKKSPKHQGVSLE